MILVTGATGTIGRHLVGILGEMGAPFRALVRDEAGGRALGCEFVVGDLDEPASVVAALDGVDRLLLNSGGALPVAGPQPMVRQQTAAIDAAAAAGMSHLVKVSAWRPAPEAKLSVRAHWEIEQHLASSDVPWSLLRPTGYMQNFFTGEGGFAAADAVSGPYGAGRVAYIDARDIAACAAALLTGAHGTGGTGGTGRAYPLTGPEALTHAEIAAKLGVPFHDQPPAEAATQLRARGLPDWFVDDLLWLYADLAAGNLSEVTTTVHDLTGRPPRTFDAFLAARG
ncbi:NmrA family NAD(P)-binding protein [Streptomyces hainanensis]|uniref:SDR family NAD(P)-dependent oxidoreductase n=1 Tax=Streptomyces hainanensis TaxID=402648 RepID=A0A4R4TDM0_9ACTN|nr:NmrA family NAD(P)-binding protein [Streptomyces hainanensis]TDC75658.1 SDR family NAD(P)-dependent oxidoreductase [Streptomyces hainanensis]